MGFFGGGNSSSDNDGNDTNNIISESRRNSRSTLLIFVVIIAAYLAYSAIGQNGACAGQPTTTGRVRLAENLCSLTEFVFPQGGASEYSEDTMIQEEMVNFYNSSGVQPVLYDLTGQAEMSQEELQKAADDFYENKLFSNAEVNSVHDEGHFVVAFQAAGDSYKVAYHVGTNAATVIDEPALEIFSNVLADKFAKNNGPDIFKNTFKDANSQIMGRSRTSIYLIIIVVAIAVVYFVFNYMRIKKNNTQNNN